jgi:hypothetical protein
MKPKAHFSVYKSQLDELIPPITCVISDIRGTRRKQKEYETKRMYE